jgi:hypothetical protein
VQPGEYTGIVSIVSEGALNSPVFVPVMLSILGGQPPPQIMPPQVGSMLPTRQPPTDSAVLWRNSTSLYRYADSAACVVSGSITNLDDAWYMNNVRVVSKSGPSALISSSIAPRETVLYNRYIPCFEQEDVILDYTWYRQ